MTKRVSPSSRMAVEYDWSEVEAASSHEISVVKRSLPRSPTLLGRNHTSADQSRWHVGGVRQSLGVVGGVLFLEDVDHGVLSAGSGSDTRANGCVVAEAIQDLTTGSTLRVLREEKIRRRCCTAGRKRW